ncbi:MULTISPECIES: helix-turn-helix domain-containing protein [Methylocystis]|nr:MULTISPECIES: helix-turn-helix domain-containing protein [Methylocystis]
MSHCTKIVGSTFEHFYFWQEPLEYSTSVPVVAGGAGETLAPRFWRAARQGRKIKHSLSFVFMREMMAWLPVATPGADIGKALNRSVRHTAAVEMSENHKNKQNVDDAMDSREDRQNLTLQRRREDALRCLLAHVNRAPTRTIVDELKKDLGVSRATAYRMMKSFRTCGAIAPSSARSVGRPKGTKGLDPKRERIIETALAAFVAEPERPRFSTLVQEIARQCKEEALPVPNWRTIRARLRELENQQAGGGN